VITQLQHMVTQKARRCKSWLFPIHYVIAYWNHTFSPWSPQLFQYGCQHNQGRLFGNGKNQGLGWETCSKQVAQASKPSSAFSNVLSNYLNSRFGNLQGDQYQHSSCASPYSIQPIGKAIFKSLPQSFWIAMMIHSSMRRPSKLPKNLVAEAQLLQYVHYNFLTFTLHSLPFRI
jgi:hypothetical protein